MSTGTAPLPAIQSGNADHSAKPGDFNTETALAPLSKDAGVGNPTGLKGPVTRLPVQLDVAVPIRDFRVRNLLALEPGRVIESQWANGQDVPLAAGRVQLAWSEFEVIDLQLAVRVTRLV